MPAASCHALPEAGLEPAPRPEITEGPPPAPRTSPGWWGAAIDARQPQHVALVFLSFAAVVPLLYLGRSADGNAFTSWRWTFSGARVLGALAALAAAMPLVLVAARASVRLRVHPAAIGALAAAAVLPLWAEPESILDASRYLVQARSLEEYGALHFLREWGRGIDAWTDLPLVPFVYGLVFSAAGASRIAIQALDTALFAATALLVYRLARSLWDEETALHAALLLLAIPFLLVQVPLLLVDVPAMFLLALFACSFLGAVRRGGPLRVLGCALAASAAALSKYSLWPMLVVVAAGCAAAAGGPARRVLARTMGVAAAASSLLAVVLATRLDVLERQLRLLATFQWSGLGRWQEGFLSTFLFQAHPLVVVLALGGAVRAARSRDRRFLAAGGALLLALAVGSARARYAVPLLPLVALAAAYGLAAVRDRGARRLLTLCAVTTSLAVAYGAYLPFLRSTSLANLARAGRHLDALEGESVEVHALPQPLSSASTHAAIPLLGYATRKRIVCPEEWPVRADDAAARSSPLRFSWEMRRPRFFAPGATAVAGAPVVVISGDPDTAPMPGLRERARFAATSETFRYQTVVTVYERDPGT